MRANDSRLGTVSRCGVQRCVRRLELGLGQLCMIAGWMVAPAEEVVDEHDGMVECKGHAGAAVDEGEVGESAAGEFGGGGGEGDPEPQDGGADDALGGFEEEGMGVGRTSIAHVKVRLAPPRPPERSKVAEEGGDVAELFERDGVGVGVEAGGERRSKKRSL